MSGLRAWGLAGALTLLACGGRSQQRPSEPEVAGAGDGANGGGGGATTTGDAGKLSGSGAGASGASAAGGTDMASGAGGAGANAAAGADLAGGAGGTQPCQGIEPSCVPGETVCDRRKGTLTTCGDCGEPTPAENKATCVRLIASDKESNGVCVVLGEARSSFYHAAVPTATQVADAGLGDLIEAVFRRQDGCASRRHLSDSRRNRS